MFEKNYTLKEKIEQRFFNTLRPLFLKATLGEIKVILIMAVLSIILFKFGWPIANILDVSLLFFSGTCALLTLVGSVMIIVSFFRLKNAKVYQDLVKFYDKNYCYNNEKNPEQKLFKYINEKFNVSATLNENEIKELFSTGLNDNQLMVASKNITNNGGISYTNYLKIISLLSDEQLENIKIQKQQQFINQKKEDEKNMHNKLSNFIAQHGLENKFSPKKINLCTQTLINEQYPEQELEKEIEQNIDLKKLL
jgi:hypothetical protein